MLVINYSGNRPQQDRFKFAVNGDNNSQTIKFVLKKQQGDIDLSSPSFTIYFLCQSQDKRFVDKAVIETVSEEGNDIILEYKLLGKHTQYKAIDVGVSFEDENQEVVYKTASATISIQNGIMADEEIANKYPTEIGRIETRLNHSDKKFVHLIQNYNKKNKANVYIPEFTMEFDENVRLLYTIGGETKTTNGIKTVYLNTKKGNHISNITFAKGSYDFYELINEFFEENFGIHEYTEFPYNDLPVCFDIPKFLSCCLKIENMDKNGVMQFCGKFRQLKKRFSKWTTKYDGETRECMVLGRIQFKFVKNFAMRSDNKGWKGTMADAYIDTIMCIHKFSYDEYYTVYIYGRPRRF